MLLKDMRHQEALPSLRSQAAAVRDDVQRKGKRGSAVTQNARRRQRRGLFVPLRLETNRVRTMQKEKV